MAGEVQSHSIWWLDEELLWQRDTVAEITDARQHLTHRLPHEAGCGWCYASTMRSLGYRTRKPALWRRALLWLRLAVA